jgi:two-component system NtrC family sensor kinase
MTTMTAPTLPATRAKRFNRLARLRAALAACNRAIFRTADEQAMLDQVCRALVADGLFSTAWVVRYNPAAHSTTTITAAGADPVQVQPDVLTAAFDTHTALWMNRGASLAVLPLCGQDTELKALCVCADTPRAFNTTVKEQLVELATNMCFALGNFARHKEHDRVASRAQQAQRLTQAFMDNLPGTVFLKDSNLRLLKVNRHLAQSLGIAQNELIGRNNEQLFPPDFAEAANQLDRAVLASGKSQTIPQTLMDRHVETRLFVVDDGDGNRMLGGISLDVTDRFHEYERTQALLALQKLADQLDERSLLTQGLESAERLTESKIGFLHFVNDDQETLELVTWTGGALRGCTAGYDNHYPISSAGIWADCFRNRAPMVVNDYATHTIKKGLPDGHAHLERFVSVPVIEGQRVCMMLGVGNKATAYTPTDVDTLQLIGNDLWRMARRRRAEQALQQRLHELEVVNKKLADLKLHLLQTEKLASIGQLAAGVAHEINNPIGFLRSNLSTMSGYVNGLIEVVKAYKAIEASAGHEASAAVAAVRNLKQQTDHDFVVEELPTLIAESQDGIERVRKIVLDLKNFSRAGDTDWQWADLTQGLESTINIVWNQIKYKAELRREYQPMPQVYCIASQINQVVMNLLVNAVQAIDQTGTITVRTGADTTQAWIEVEDTGCGMTEEQKHHIFEPFFTTKPPGQGTGLGLAIAWRVMERHHGHFDIDSTVSQGTRIRINLPIDNRQTPAATLPAQDTPA